MNGSKLEPKYYKASRLKEQFHNAHEEQVRKNYYPDYEHKYNQQKEKLMKSKKPVWNEADQLFEDELWNS